jgi:hypothetical protein
VIRFSQLARWVALGVLALTYSQASAAMISVASWNVANRPNSSPDQAGLERVLGYMGQVAGGPLDLLGLIETDAASAVTTVTSAQTVFAGSTYASLITAPDGGGDRTGFLYNTATLSLIESVELSGGSLTHRSIRARFQPIGQSPAAGFYVYSVHLKSGDGTADRATRAAEAQQLRNDADALGTANVMFVGDFNWQSATERGLAGASAYEVFSAAGEGRAVDPLNAVGVWRDNPAFLNLHTNAPDGAMDDRFDMHLVSDELLDGLGLDYLDASYAVIGNNGTHTLNDTILTGTGAPAEILAALADFSDHLPVLSQYALVPEPAVALTVTAICFVASRRRRG